MAIGQSFGLQFGYQTMIPKKEKKEELQSRMFPGLDDGQSKRLIETVDKMGIADNRERLKKQQEIYKEVLPQIKAKEAQMNRQVIKNEQYNATLDIKDPKQKAVKMAGLRMEDLADMIKEKYDLDPNAPTDGIISEYNTMLNDMGIDEKLVEDYMNGKSDELLYVTELKVRPEDNTAKDIGAIAGAGIGAVGLAGAVGKVAEKAGKIVYGLTLTNPEDIAQKITNAEESIKELKLEKVRIKEGNAINKKELLKSIDDKIKVIKDTMPESIADVGLRTKGAWGSLRKIGTEISATASDVAKRYIEPGLEKATTELGKISVGDIFKNVEKKIENLALSKGEAYANQVKEAFNDIKSTVFSNKKTITYQEANAVKSGIYDLTTSRLKKGLIDPNTSKMAKDFIGSELVKIISTALRKIDPTGKTLKEYKSYGTRKLAKDISKKSIKSPGIDNALGTVSAIIKAVAAPGTTILGKTLVTVGKGLQYPIKKIAQGIKYIAKSPAGKVAKGLMMVDPTGTLTDIIENEIYTKGFTKSQYSLYVQMRLAGIPAEDAAKFAKEADGGNEKAFKIFY